MQPGYPQTYPQKMGITQDVVFDSPAAANLFHKRLERFNLEVRIFSTHTIHDDRQEIVVAVDAQQAKSPNQSRRRGH